MWKGMPTLLPYNVNCLVNSTDPNSFVTFAVNSIDPLLESHTRSDNLFQDGTIPDLLDTTSPESLPPAYLGARFSIQTPDVMNQRK